MIYKTLRMDEVAAYVAFLHHRHMSIIDLVIANGVVSIRHVSGTLVGNF